MPIAARQATRQRAAHDILLQAVARVLNLGLGVIVTALVVRTLGSARFGQWSTVLVVISLLAYFASFGMETVAVREAAKDPRHENEWIGAVMLMRLIVLPAVILVSLGVVIGLSQNREMRIAGLILILTMPFGGVGALQLLFQLRVNNLVPMLVLTLRSVLWGAGVAIIYWRGGSLIALAVALAATNAVGSVVQAWAAMRLTARFPRPSRKQLRRLLRSGLPVGISGVLIIAYARIDQVMVFEIAGSRAAGLYGSVYLILEQSHFIPISVLTTLAPVMAAAWPNDRGRMLRAARLAGEWMAIMSFGALAFASVASEQVIRLFFGPTFIPAAPALPVLGGAFVLICFGYLTGNLLVVLGLERRLVLVGLAALAVNVAGNLIVIPLLGFLGAAWMTLITEMVVFAASVWMILRELEHPRPKLGRIGRTVLAALLLAVGLSAVKLAGAPLAMLVGAAGVAYPGLLLALRAVQLDDVRILISRGTLA